MSAAGLHLLAINRVVKAHNLPALARHAKAQSKRLSRGGAAIALLARQFAHPGIEQPRPLRARLLAVAGVRRREIAVGEAFLKDRLGHLPVQRSAFGLLVFLVPAQAQPLQSFENGVHRGIGIALHIGIVEPQNHRSAVPAGIQPVKNKSARAAHVKKSGGRGRKTHSRLAARREFNELDMSQVGLSMVRAAKKRSSSGNAQIDFACNPLIQKEIEGGQCT